MRIETSIVGFYTVIIAFFISFFIPNTNEYKTFLIFLFILGFLKHFLGYWLQLQTLYCNYGIACKREKNKQTTTHWKAKEPSFIENIGEGILFVMVGFLIKKIFHIHNIYLISFFIGLFTHLIFELLGFHAFFCKNRCFI